MIDSRIVSFLQNCTIATVCCADGEYLWCFHCFFTLLIFNQEGEDKVLLIYKSTGDTKHDLILQQNQAVAGTVLPSMVNFACLQGVQFEGYVIEPEKNLLNIASEAYYRKFPIGEKMKGDIHIIEVASIKFTDNSLGIGNKICWNKK